MENSMPTQTKQTFDHDALLLASLILRDVNQIRTGIQTIVAVVLCYAAKGSTITNGLMSLLPPGATQE